MKRTSFSREPGKPAWATLEKHVQRACLEYLNLQPQTRAWRNNSGASLIPNEDPSKRRFFRYGEVGSADIIGLTRGIFLAIECKRPGKRATEAQEAWLKQIATCGGIAFVVDSLEALQTFWAEEAKERGW